MAGAPMPHYVAARHTAAHHVSPCQDTSHCHAMSCQNVSHHVIPCHPVSHHARMHHTVTPRHAISHHITPFLTTSHYARTCHAVSHHVMPCRDSTTVLIPVPPSAVAFSSQWGRGGSSLKSSVGSPGGKSCGQVAFGKVPQLPGIGVTANLRMVHHKRTLLFGCLVKGKTEKDTDLS